MVFLENFGWLLVLIGVMILIHELGHYWAARYFDVRVATFSFGFGPRLFGFRKGDTDFRFSLILFGGYVKMAGEHPGDDADPRGFLLKPRWQRLIIAAAGPAMNIVLAIGLLTGLYMFKFPKTTSTSGPAVVGYVTADTPAARAGIREGDEIVALDGSRNPTWEDVLLKEIAGVERALSVLVRRGSQTLPFTVTPVLDDRTGMGSAGWSGQAEILVGSLVTGMDAERQGLQAGDALVSINGQPIRSIQKVHDLIRASGGQPVHIAYSRNGLPATLTVQPTFSEEQGGRWLIGVQLSHRLHFIRLSFAQALTESTRQNFRGAGLIFQFLRGVIERRLSARSLEGPIRIAQLSGEAAREGPGAFVSLMSTVSLNLAIFNLLPIPILDGGVIILLLIEMLIRRDLSLSIKEAVFKVGFVFLMMLVVFVLYNDIAKILPG
jgi:regulator of sigma E protease